MAEAKKGRGCFFYGCVTLIVVFIVVFVAALIGGRLLYNKALAGTDSRPQAIEPMKLSDSEGDRLVNSVADYKKLIAGGQSAPPLELSSDQLEYLVRNNPDAAHIRDFAHITITNDELQAQLSLPLDQIPGFKGRFLNGQARFGLNVRDGTIHVTMKSMEVKGKPLPDNIMQGFRQPIVIDDPALAKNIESVEIKNGKMVITPKLR